MTVVVTGSGGFIGRHLVVALRDRGERVVGIDRRPAAPTAGSSLLVADLLDRDSSAEAALREADVVFHLAARPGVRDSGPGVVEARWRDNVVATARVLALVPRASALVVTSSSSVYGGALGRGCRESDPLRPRGGYARTKAEVERLCGARFANGGHVGVARPFTVAGEWQRADMAVATWLAAATLGRPITVLGSPARTRDVTDVRDVVRGLVAMADRGVHGAVNLGTGVGHRLDELVAAVLMVTGAPAEMVVSPADRDEVPDTLADTTRLRALLGFLPRTDLHQLVRRQAAAAGLLPGEPAAPSAGTELASR